MSSLDSELNARAQRVRLLVLDVDGVLTDGRIYYGGDGVELKAFNIQDGLGIRMLMASGVEVAIISGRRSSAVEARARDLGIVQVTLGASDKLNAFAALLAERRLSAEQAAAVGDDLPDLPVLRRCTFAATVPDAPDTVRRYVHYITRKRGGEGAVREVCEVLMQAQGTLDAQLQEFLR